MEIKWTISDLNRRTSDGYVTTAHWRCTGVDGDFTGTVYATTSWADGQPTVPYDDLKEQEVLDWIWASGVDKDATEASVTAQIDAQKNPVEANGLPWSQTV